MKKYIIDLTNQLIERHKFDESKLWTFYKESSRSPFGTTFEFYVHVSINLSDYKAETLGRIFGSITEIDASKEKIFTGLRTEGGPRRHLEDLTGMYLACIIRDRVNPDGDPKHLSPPYRRAH